MKVKGLDHIVIKTEDVDGLLEFYRDVMGLDVLREEEFRDMTDIVGLLDAPPTTSVRLALFPQPVSTRRWPMAKVVNCPCGQTIKADTDDELVGLVQAHGKDVHDQEVKREDVLAMARPE